MTTPSAPPLDLDALERIDWAKHPGDVTLHEARLMLEALPALIARQRTLEAALEGLLDEVEWFPDGTPYLVYTSLRDEAWQQARAALAQGSGSPEPNPQGQEARDG